MATDRVTVSLPTDVIEEMDRHGANRSRFVLDAVRRELQRRRREELRRSLARPHPDSKRLARSGLRDWALGLPSEDVGELVDVKGGTPVRWVPGKGWTQGAR